MADNTRGQWAHDFLMSAGFPVTNENLIAVVAWEKAEGTRARNNPLATTYTLRDAAGKPLAGQTNLNSVGVKNYPDYNAGLEATVKTIRLGYYAAIRAALASGSSAEAVGAAVAASPWGTGGGVLANIPAVRKTYAKDAAHAGNTTADSGAAVSIGQLPGEEALGNAVAGAVASTMSTAQAIGKAYAWITDRKNTVRVLEVTGGFAAVVLGLVMLNRDLLAPLAGGPAAGAAAAATKAASTLAAAA